MPTAHTKLTLERIKSEARTFGLTDADLNALTFHVFPGDIRITAYPEGNPKARKFFDHLVDTGLASRRDGYPGVSSPSSWSRGVEFRAEGA